MAEKLCFLCWRTVETDEDRKLCFSCDKQHTDAVLNGKYQEEEAGFILFLKIYQKFTDRFFQWRVWKDKMKALGYVLQDDGTEENIIVTFTNGVNFHRFTE